MVSPDAPSMPALASEVLSPDHHTKSLIVAGPWLAKYLEASSASARSPERSLLLAIRSCRSSKVGCFPSCGPKHMMPSHAAL